MYIQVYGLDKNLTKPECQKNQYLKSMKISDGSLTNLIKSILGEVIEFTPRMDWPVKRQATRESDNDEARVWPEARLSLNLTRIYARRLCVGLGS